MSVEMRDVERDVERDEDLVQDLDAEIDDARAELVEKLDRLGALTRFRELADQAARELERPTISLEELVAFSEADELMRAEVRGLADRIAEGGIDDG